MHPYPYYNINESFWDSLSGDERPGLGRGLVVAEELKTVGHVCRHCAAHVYYDRSSRVALKLFRPAERAVRMREKVGPLCKVRPLKNRLKYSIAELHLRVRDGVL